jgi:murein DD-endopeptidase MepM/ murein hydrolase activator NlpD
MFAAVLQRPGALDCGWHTVAGMFRLVLVMLLGAGLFVLDVGGAAAAQRWRMPVPRATVVGAFGFDRAAPYAGGQRRGIDVRGEPGARVVAACAGIVTYAGRVPGWGRGVSLRCGGLVATELGLVSASVARGARLWPGATLGRLGARGLLRLGARRASSRQGYVDPLGLLSRDERPSPPAVAPRGGPAVRPRSRFTSPAAPATSRRAATAVAPVATPHPTATVAPHDVALPWSAWAGLALLAASAGGGGVVRRHRHGRGRIGMALAQR